MRGRPVLLSVTMVLALPLSAAAQGAVVPTIPALVETTPVPGDGATGTAFWLDPVDPAQSMLIGGDENRGIGLYDLAGNELQYLAEGPLKNVDLRYDVLVGADRVDLVAVSVEDQPQVRFYAVDGAARQLRFINEMPIGIPGDGVCLYRSPFTGRLFVIVTSADGVMEQWRLDGEDGTIRGTLARAVPVGSEVGGCTVDDDLAQLYVGEEELGIWQYGAEPEAGSARRLVDFAGEHPEGGHLLEQVEGLAIVPYEGTSGYLVASNEKADSLNIYTRDGDHDFLGSVRIGEGAGIDGVSEPGGVAVLPVPLGDAFPAGAIATSDDTNTDPNDDKSFKLASWGAMLAAAGLPADPSPVAVRRDPVLVTGRDAAISLVATAETVSVPSGTDAADDPAIYIHPSDPSLDAIIGTDKTGALVVYELDGSIRQSLPIGRVNNVDLRDGFMVDGVPRTLVVTGNRTDNSLWFYLMDEATGTLVEAHRDPVRSDVNEVYGVCLYRQPDTGTVFAFVNSTDTGEVEQYLVSVDAGAVITERVREFVVGSQTEGCVVDDPLRTLYIGEELVGIWKYGADPEAGDMRVAVDTVTDGNLVADVEGLALLAGAGESGYLIASSQGESRFVVYERAGDNRFVGKFQLIDGPGMDAVSGTDGIEASLAALPAPYEGGLLVAQDDLNREPDANQNFKLVRWADVATAMGLEPLEPPPGR